MDAPRHADGSGPVPGLGFHPPVSERDYLRIADGAIVPMRGSIAGEVPVALSYLRHPHAVMMCTPADFEDFAIGFTLSEEIVGSMKDIERVDVVRHSRGVEVDLTIPAALVERLAHRSRSIAGRTGCGLCGVQVIDEAIRIPRQVPPGSPIAARALWRAAAELDARQVLNRGTLSIHAAAFATRDGEVRIAREDVGRHNALDKVLGALARAGTDPTAGFLVVTSRASYELVQKAAVFGVPLLAAVSRPTQLAIELAQGAGIALVGLLRDQTANLYSHPERVHG